MIMAIVPCKTFMCEIECSVLKAEGVRITQFAKKLREKTGYSMVIF
jgi:hypothetical protein